MTRRIITVGELTIDDVVVEDVGCDWKQVGGGALYSAIGALAWGALPTICATIGPDYPEDGLQRLTRAGIEVSGLTRFNEPSLGLWLLYEHGGRRHQVQKESGSGFAALDDARRPWSEVLADPDGLHVAPQTPAGQRRALAEAAQRGVVTTQDLLIEPFIDVAGYRDGSALAGATAFLPSLQEVHQVWGDVEAQWLLQELRRRAGIGRLVIKRGALGADVVTDEGVVRVPPVAEQVVDPTGAGDAFCGGFLIGLLETGDTIEAAAYGAVAASFVVETRGALEALARADEATARARLARVHPIGVQG